MSPFDIPRKSSGTGGRQSQTECSVMMSDIDCLVVVKPARMVLFMILGLFQLHSNNCIHLYAECFTDTVPTL